MGDGRGVDHGHEKEAVDRAGKPSTMRLKAPPPSRDATLPEDCLSTAAPTVFKPTRPAAASRSCPEDAV